MDPRYMNLSDQMHAQFMANTGGLRMQMDLSRPAIYNGSMYDNFYDTRFKTVNELPEPMRFREPEPMRFREVEPIVFKPLDLGRDVTDNLLGTTYNENLLNKNKDEMERWNPLARILPSIKTFPDYSDY